MSIEQVLEFHRRFQLPEGDKDRLDQDAFEFRRNFLQEELDEFAEAFANGNRVGMFDALLDLAYVTYGTALFMGVTDEQWREGMAAVHAANMAKIRASAGEDSKRGSVLDVVKPGNWTGPEHVLEQLLAGEG